MNHLHIMMFLGIPEIDAIGASLIGIGTVILPGLGVWIVGRQTIEIGRRQLEVAAANVERQVAATIEAAKLGYRAQVLSGNRQAWINDLRNVCSETAAIMKGAQDDLRSGKAVRLDKFERYLQCKTKLKLMLNPDD